MIIRLRLTPGVSLIGAVTLWACGGEVTTGPADQQQPSAAQLAFRTEPSATAGEAISPAIKVEIVDAFGNVVTTTTDAVTIAIGTNPAGGTLSGTATVNAVAGVASFSDLTIGKAGSGYTLAASASGLSSATSSAFTVRFPFTIVGHGSLARTVTSDVRVHGTVAYTGEFDFWADGTNPVTDALLVWDVSNPATPRVAASVVADGVMAVIDVKIRADGTVGVITHQFSGSGITLLDLSDPLSPQVITRFTPGALSLGVHNTWIEGDYVYAAGGAREGGRLTIIDISNPADPQVVADFYAGLSGAHDVYVRDGLAFVSHWDAGLVILDVGNGIAGGTPTNPVEVGRTLTVGGSTHSAWYWPAARYVFVSEESRRPGVVHVVDVSDLSNPVEVATFGVSGHTAHNLSMDEARGILYVSWLGGGLRAIDVSGELSGRLETQGREVGYTGQAMGSVCPIIENLCRPGTLSWGVQLHDGLVYVSDVNSGLWVLRLEF